MAAHTQRGENSSGSLEVGLSLWTFTSEEDIELEIEWNRRQSERLSSDLIFLEGKLALVRRRKARQASGSKKSPRSVPRAVPDKPSPIQHHNEPRSQGRQRLVSAINPNRDFPLTQPWDILRGESDTQTPGSRRQSLDSSSSRQVIEVCLPGPSQPP